jgi:type I restriction enzyme S subunit
VSEYPIGLPPLSEQRRIVTKIEELFSNLDAGMDDLQAAGQQLERYRLSVLQAAVEGRLTADWRRTHDPEPADRLLERILEERENSSYVRKPSLEEFEDGVPSKIPEDWAWTRVGAVCYVRGGKAFRSKNYEDEGIPLVRISNIEDRKVSFEEDTVYLPPSFAKEHGRYLMKEGDIVIAMSGATTGKLGVFEGDDDSALLNQRVGRFEFFDHDLISEDYFFYFLLTIQDNILKEAYGAAQPNISATAISNFALALPPLQEQSQIASEVERLLSVADDARATTEREHTRAERLRQSILKQAFSGRLVPHDEDAAPPAIEASSSNGSPSLASEETDSSSDEDDVIAEELYNGGDPGKQIEMDL